nr:NAD(P)-dependent oxidoreductase [Saccharopolyspora pogona]
MGVDDAELTIVLSHPAAESYARPIGDRFPQVRAIIAPDSDRLERHIGEADALLAPRFPVEVFERAGKLRWFQCTGAGVDSLLAVRDTNARGIHGDVIADFVMAGVTMLHWDFRGFLREQAEKRWNPRHVASLADRTLGIVGVGSIGATIARRAKSAGMTVLGSKRDISVPVAGVDQLFSADALADMLPLCDFLVLALPATPDTVGLIGAAEIACMKPKHFWSTSPGATSWSKPTSSTLCGPVRSPVRCWMCSSRNRCRWTVRCGTCRT